MATIDFSVVLVEDETVYIKDLNKGGISVTNGAEVVVKTLFDRYGNRRIIYRDSDGNWDELLHRRGEFLGFALGIKIDDAD